MSGDSIDQTKKIIRSLLISAKNGLYMEQLDRDYRSQKGTPIPYSEYGFSDLKEFLFSIPDVVRVARSGRTLHLTGVPTSETSHIARMVQQQTGGTTSILSISDNKQSKYNQHLYMSNIANKPRAAPRVPNNICLQMKEILLSCPNGIEINNFPRTYQKRFGHGIQYIRLGYSSLDQLIRAVPGVTTVMIDKREYIIYSSTVARKLSPPYSVSPPGFSKKPAQPYVTTPDNLDTIDLVQNKPPITEETPALCESEDSLPPPKETVEPVLEISTDTVEEQERPPDEGTSPDPNASPPSTPGTSVSRTLPQIPYIKPLHQAAQLAMHKQKQGQNMFDKLSREISDLLSTLPEVTPLKELEIAYQARYDFELPYLEFGFSSSKELAESLWNVCSLEQRDSGVFVRFLGKKRVQTPLEPISMDDYAHGCPHVDPGIGRRVRNLLLKWPSGMPLSLLQGKYKDAYQEELPVLELGFEELLYMMLAMPDCVSLTPWSPDASTTDYILHGVPLTSRELQGQVLPAPSAPSDDVITSYENQPVPPSWEFNVYIPFISNPDRFWIQVVGSRTTSAVENILEKMTLFYSRMSSQVLPEYMIPSPKEGQNCAAPYQGDGNYYRAKVLRILSQDQAEVYYVDYGNKSRVPIPSLRKIQSSNMLIPAQAIRCRLANVRPVDHNRWPPGSANKMKDLTNNLELLCKVQNVEPDDILSVHLYDPSSESGASINQALIATGIAVHEDNNTPLHPARACLSPEGSTQMSSFPPAPLPPQNQYPPPLPPFQVPYNLPPPGMMPPPPPYHPMPFYNYPQPMGPPLNYMNPMLPPYPPHPNTYIHPYAQLPPAPPHYHRNYLTASAPPPQAPIRPTLNFQMSSSASVDPVSLPESSTLLQGDTYMFNDTDDQALDRRLKEKRPVLEKRDQFDLSPDMGTLEKVHKYLSSSKTPDEFDTQIGAHRAKLEQLKNSRVQLVESKVDISDRTEFNRYLSQLNALSDQIEQLENKFADILALDPATPTDVAPPPIFTSSTVPTLSGSQPILTQTVFQSSYPSLVPRPVAPVIGASQPQAKYKGIGRGGKMSDLV